MGIIHLLRSWSETQFKNQNNPIPGLHLVCNKFTIFTGMNNQSMCFWSKQWFECFNASNAYRQQRIETQTGNSS